MSHLFQTYGRWNVEIKEAEGSWAVDTTGKKYLDFIQGIAVTNLGHNHPKVNQAIKKLDEVWHVSNLFENGLQEKQRKSWQPTVQEISYFSATAGLKRMKGLSNWPEKQQVKQIL